MKTSRTNKRTKSHTGHKTYEYLVGNAIMSTDPAERELYLDRTTCKTTASTLMFCSCGNCLDQETVMVLEVWSGKEYVYVNGYCPDCREKVEKVCDKKGYDYRWITWNGRIVKSLSLIAKEKCLEKHGLKQDMLF